MLGDCLDLMEKIPTGSVDMVMADPSYGVPTGNKRWGGEIIPLGPMWEQLVRVTKPRGAIVMTANQPFTTMLIVSNVKMFKYCWTWIRNRKTGFPNAKKQPLRNTGDIPVFYEKQCTYNPQGIIRINKKMTKAKGRGDNIHAGENDGSLAGSFIQEFTNYPSQVLHIDSQWKTIHPTQKPVALMEYLIRTYTDEGETVLDFVMGSGTTGVACVNLDRGFIGIEIDEAYFDMADRRIEV